MARDDHTEVNQAKAQLDSAAGARLRWLARPVLAVIAMIATARLAISAALVITPMQTVTVAGQVINLGAAVRPSPSGPGEVDPFGQSLATAVSFPGPTRAAATLRSQLVAGWERYFGWETAAAALAALTLAGAVAGWRRLKPRSTAWLLAASIAVTELVNGPWLRPPARFAHDGHGYH